ncbi:hypothetical protein V5N11_030729 [Cardamine amara subsp. amara]|uniref:Uncharacterized protein n=1 Tax=Cardamine amara subsp. amara TaxID=228776 RepID=A0ABD0ZLD2_CARAN
MGNYVSSALTKTSSSSSSSSAAKVILPDGGVRLIHAPMKAAELMMEIPSFFFVDAKSLKIGRKLSPLAADDDLQIKGCHRSKKQRRRVGADSYGSGTVVKNCHNGKVSPDGEEDDVKIVSVGSKLNLEDIEDFSAAEFMHRISISKSKKPNGYAQAEDSRRRLHFSIVRS